jgi:predicted GNAT family N-acyltransferase
MVFWKSFPIQICIESLLSKSPFIPLIFSRDNPIIPDNITIEIYTKSYPNPRALENVLKQIQGFLKSNFGNPPKTPILDIPIQKLLLSKDHIIIAKHNNTLIGCIRYRYIGRLYPDNTEIYCEDCFCIHPLWRRKGIGDILLTTLHNYVNKHNISYSIFLKEGQSLICIYRYMYKQYTKRYTRKNI